MCGESICVDVNDDHQMCDVIGVDDMEVVGCAGGGVDKDDDADVYAAGDVDGYDVADGDDNDDSKKHNDGDEDDKDVRGGEDGVGGDEYTYEAADDLQADDVAQSVND